MKTFEESIKAVRLLNTHRPVAAFDTETTGTKPDRDFITEFSGVLYEWDGKEWGKRDEMEVYIRPPFPVSAKITEITGFTNEFLSRFQDESAYFDDIMAFLNKGVIYAGQNVPFDIGMVNAMSMRLSGKEFDPKCTIDTLTIARELIKRNDLDERTYKLCNIAKYYGVSSGGFHNATDDVRNTWDVLQAEMADFLRQYNKQKKEHPDVVRDIRVYGMRRWKLAKGKFNRQDRLYLDTSAGPVTFDLLTSSYEPGDGKTYPEGQALVREMRRYAMEAGFSSYREYENG